MRLVALLAATMLLLGISLSTASATPANSGIQLVAGQAPLLTVPAESKKKKKKKTPSATPSASPTQSPSPSAARTAADQEGDRWMLLALIAGGGLLMAVLVIFLLGAFLRRRPRSDQ